jgi:outer membrane lipoprotein-sorting protein
MTTRWWGALALLLAAAAAGADEKGDELIRKAREAMAKPKTILANIEFKGGGDVMTGRFRGMKPSYGRLFIKSSGGPQTIISDGKKVFMVMTDRKEYQTLETSDPTSVLSGMPGSPIQAFYRPETIGKDVEARFVEEKEVDGVRYQVVEMAVDQNTKQRLYLHEDGTVRGLERVVSTPMDQQTVSLWLKDVELDAPMKSADFAYTPPKGFTKPKGPEDSLLAVGKPAPDFLLDQPGKLGLLGLEQTLKTKKAVLINFWFYN